MASLYPINHPNTSNDGVDNVSDRPARKKHVPRKFTFDFSKDKRLANSKSRTDDAQKNAAQQAAAAEQQQNEQAQRERERLEAQQRELRFRKIQEDRTLAMMRQAEARAMEQQQLQQQQMRQQQSMQQSQAPVSYQNQQQSDPTRNVQSQSQSYANEADLRYQREREALNRQRSVDEEQKQRYDFRDHAPVARQTEADRYDSQGYNGTSTERLPVKSLQGQGHAYTNSNGQRCDDTRCYPTNEKTTQERLRDAAQVDVARRQATADLQRHQDAERERQPLRPSKQPHGFLHTIASIFKNH